MSNEQFLTLTEGTKVIPGRPHASTLWRWARKGVKVRGSQERVRLQHVRAGARILTTQPWLEEFMANLASADEAHFERPHGSLVHAHAPSCGERAQTARAIAADAAHTRLKRYPHMKNLQKRRKS